LTASDLKIQRIRACIPRKWETAFNIGFDAGYSGECVANVIRIYLSDLCEIRFNEKLGVKEYRLKSDVKETLY
jgi:hypothetical protein